MTTERGAATRCWHSAIALVGVAAVVAGCGGSGAGGGATEISVASGQSVDAVVVDVPIAYIRRFVPGEDDPADLEDDARELLEFDPGARLLVRERAAPAAVETDLTPGLGEGAFDVRDLDVSPDGTRLIFAARGPFDADLDDDELPTWNLWTYDFTTTALTRVIASDTTAEAGHDRFPTFLPDGRILFSSTRQRRSRAVLLDEGRPQFEGLDEDRNEPAFVLHAMNDDGTDIRQISFNQSHDLAPTVMDDGRVVFSRWDRSGRNDGIHLYRMNPDGTDLELLYGKHSHDTGTDDATVQFLRPRDFDGRVLVLLRPFETDDGGADLVLVDVEGFVEQDQGLALGAGIAVGPAQEAATINDVRTDGSISPGGRYAAAWPLGDGTGRMFVAWSLCRLLDADGRIVRCSEEALADPLAVAAPPLYGLYLYDRTTDTQVPVLRPEEGVLVTEVVAAQSRPEGLVRFDAVDDGTADPELVARGTGLLSIRSVYDIEGVDASEGIDVLADPALRTAAQRPARFLRISKAVSIPDDDVRDFDRSAFGRGGPRGGMREVLAYAEIEPDGSVLTEVPADVPLSIEVLDGAGRRIGDRHDTWLQLRPGQTLACNGCHTRDAERSHGRVGAFEAAHDGAPTTGLPYPNTVDALFADAGETMAEIRVRVSCETDCAARQPSLDIVYEDVWTDAAAAGRAPDEAFAWRYSQLATPAPTTTACVAEWNALCRSTIHYETHVHPLWSTPRLTLDPADGVTVLADDTCIACHSREDAAGMIRVPDGDLDLTDGASPVDADHFNAYRELVYPRDAREVAGGILQPILVEVGIDPDTGDPILQTVTLRPSVSVGRANSASFFDLFAPGGSHAGRMTPAELRLLSEWIDGGTQYFNDPFAAPED